MALSRRHRRKLVALLVDDRVASVAHFLSKHRLSVGSAVSSGRGRVDTVLHQICHRGAINVFWSLQAGVDTAMCCATDRRGRTPAHRAIGRLIKCKNMSIYTNLVQPLAEICPAAFLVRDRRGQKPLQLLLACHSLSTAGSMLSRHLAAMNSTKNEPNKHTDSCSVWSQKLLDEIHYENRHFDNIDNDMYDDSGNRPESFADWSERISREYSAKHRPLPQDRERRRADTRQEHMKESQTFPDPGNTKGRCDSAGSEELVGESSFPLADQLFDSFQQLQLALTDSRSQSAVSPNDFQLLANLRAVDVRHLVERISVMTSLSDVTHSANEKSGRIRRVVCDLLRVWHPDKCWRRISSLLDSNGSQQQELDCVKASVLNFVQHLNSFL